MCVYVFQLDRYVHCRVCSVSALMLPMDFSTLFDLCVLAIARFIYILIYSHMPSLN